MKQKRRWFFTSAIDETDLTEISFKEELLDSGEPMQDIVDFYDGRLIPQPSIGETYVSRSNTNYVLISKVEKDKISYTEEDCTISGLPIKTFLGQFKLQYGGNF